MITLLSLTTEITRKDCFSHLEFPFVADKDYSKLQIKYSYYPKDYLGSDDYQMAFRAFREAYLDYPIQKEVVKNELPLKNHLTLSLQKGNALIGTAHRHNNDMVVEVGEDLATEGFSPTKIAKGEYGITLSAHAILTEKVIIKLAVVAYE